MNVCDKVLYGLILIKGYERSKARFNGLIQQKEVPNWFREIARFTTKKFTFFIYLWRVRLKISLKIVIQTSSLGWFLSITENI